MASHALLFRSETVLEHIGAVDHKAVGPHIIIRRLECSVRFTWFEWKSEWALFGKGGKDLLSERNPVRSVAKPIARSTRYGLGIEEYLYATKSIFNIFAHV
jgi:hypothetical protein